MTAPAQPSAAQPGDAAVSSKKVIYAAIVANLGIAAAKFIVAAITGSAAMMAEGIHSAVDTGNEVLLLVGEKMSARQPDARHPFGYGKAVYFWALIVALSVFSLGGGLSIYHGVHGLLDSRPVAEPLWSYIVLAVAAAFEGYSWNLSRRSLNNTARTATACGRRCAPARTRRCSPCSSRIRRRCSACSWPRSALG